MFRVDRMQGFMGAYIQGYTIYDYGIEKYGRVEGTRLGSRRWRATHELRTMGARGWTGRALGVGPHRRPSPLLKVLWPCSGLPGRAISATLPVRVPGPFPLPCTDLRTRVLPSGRTCLGLRRGGVELKGPDWLAGLLCARGNQWPFSRGPHQEKTEG